MSDVESALPTKTREEVDVSPIGLAIALGGAALAVVAVFLPVWDESSTGFFRVVGNSLLGDEAQHHLGGHDCREEIHAM